MTFSLAGRLSYANTASGSILTINTAGLNLPTDEYELTLEGTGSNVIKNLQGNALDGQNTPNDNPNGVQQALPSGTGTPGSNFYLQFTIDTHAPSIVPGTFMLAPSSVTGSLPYVTDNNTPSFTGTDHRHLPAGEPAAGRHGFPRRPEPDHRSVGPGRPDDDQCHRQLHGHGKLAAARYALQCGA